MGLHFWSNLRLGAFDALGPPLAPSGENSGFAATVAVSVRTIAEAVVKDFDAEVLRAMFAHTCPCHTCSVNNDFTAGDPSQRTLRISAEGSRAKNAGSRLLSASS